MIQPNRIWCILKVIGAYFLPNRNETFFAIRYQLSWLTAKLLIFCIGNNSLIFILKQRKFITRIYFENKASIQK